MVSYRRATEADVDRLVAWHAGPEVARYWDGETFTAEEMRRRLARADVDTWIIEEDGEPVGALESWWNAGAPRRGGLDGFLVPDARGRAGACGRPPHAGVERADRRSLHLERARHSRVGACRLRRGLAPPAR
jgi:hypothetical protein